jgi:hypothetical protein
METKPHGWAVAVAVVITLISLATAWSILVSEAEREYRWAQAGERSWLGLFLLKVVLPMGILTLVYPLIGRFAAYLATKLTASIDRTYSFEYGGLGRWHPDGLILYGAAWPITAWTLPLLIFALLMGVIYRSLWR